MINFFRRIRKKLADENKPLKYMRYAIGEILLVVVGILIALQINNWNEQRKLKAIELKLLEELYTTIEGDLNLNAYNFQRNERGIYSAQILIDNFEKERPYHDSLNLHFANALGRYIALTRNNAYENIKEYGLDFISNDSTKLDISWMYETTINWLKILDDRFALYEYTYMRPKLGLLFKNISIHTRSMSEDRMVPINYETLKFNLEFKGILNNMINNKIEYVIFQKILYDRMQKLLVRIEKEIELKKSN